MINAQPQVSQINNTISFDEFRKKAGAKQKAQQTSNQNPQKQSKSSFDTFLLHQNNNASTSAEPQKSNTNIFKKFGAWLMAPSKMYQGQNNAPRTAPNNLQAIISIGINIAIFAFLFKFLNKSLKITSGETPVKSFENIWQDLTQASGLKDLALPDILKETAQNIVYKINNAKEYIEKGGTGKNSILFYGPPGTGKTTFAKAIAKEFPNAEFASIDLSTIQGKFVGETENNLNRMVETICDYADKNPGKKIFAFIDEIDSLALEDKGSNNQQYHAGVLNTLKKCISEKLAQRKNIITLAATNIDIDPNKEINNSAKELSKPILDRFNQRIKVGNPTASQFRKAIANHYKNKTQVESSLKDEASEQVAKIAQTLEEQKCSFRSLETLYDVSATINKKPGSLTFDDIMAAINQIIKVEDKSSRIKIGFQYP